MCCKLQTLFNKKYTPQQVLPKIRYFCSYQERCHNEVIAKLYAYGLRKQDVEVIVSELIEEDYLNEERFAIQYAGGKFRLKNWGRIRIKHELKNKKVSEYCIKKALKGIDETDYLLTLSKLVASKWNALKNEQYINRQVKTTQFLLQKGFEAELIKAEIVKIRSKSND